MMNAAARAVVSQHSTTAHLRRRQNLQNLRRWRPRAQPRGSAPVFWALQFDALQDLVTLEPWHMHAPFAWRRAPLQGGLVSDTPPPAHMHLRGATACQCPIGRAARGAAFVGQVTCVGGAVSAWLAGAAAALFYRATRSTFCCRASRCVV